MIALDASVLIAHLTPLDTHHDAATRLLLDSVTQELVVHGLTLAEVLVGAVRAGRGPELQDQLRDIGIRMAARDDAEPRRLAELRAQTGLKLPDCCVLDAAGANRAALATFDIRLAEAAGRLGIPVVPRQ